MLWFIIGVMLSVMADNEWIYEIHEERGQVIVEPLPGTQISWAAEKVVEIRQQFDKPLILVFGDCRILIGADDTAESVEEAYWRCVDHEV